MTSPGSVLDNRRAEALRVLLHRTPPIERIIGNLETTEARRTSNPVSIHQSRRARPSSNETSATGL